MRGEIRVGLRVKCTFFVVPFCFKFGCVKIIV